MNCDNVSKSTCTISRMGGIKVTSEFDVMLVYVYCGCVYVGEVRVCGQGERIVVTFIAILKLGDFSNQIANYPIILELGCSNSSGNCHSL